VNAMIEYFVHVANVLILISFSVRSMLLLRTLNVIAGGFFIVWAFSFEQPLWASIGWSIVFGLVNTWRIWTTILERRPPTLAPEEQKLWKNGFADLEAREFRKLIDIGTWGDENPPQPLVENGHLPKRIWMLASGCISVQRNENVLRHLKAGDFVGETCFFAKEPSQADAVVSESVRYVSWNIEDLERFMTQQPETGAKLQRIFGQGLARKLAAA